jgi:hypothetical protein
MALGAREKYCLGNSRSIVLSLYGFRFFLLVFLFMADGEIIAVEQFLPCGNSEVIQLFLIILFFVNFFNL